MNKLSSFFNSILDPLKRLTGSKGFKSVIGSLLAIIIGLGFGMLLMVLVNPTDASGGIQVLLKGYLNNPFGATRGFGQMIYRATPLIFTGLAVAFAFKTGLFNIGASGQFTVGLFCAALVGILGDSLGSFQWVVAILAGMAGGFIWGAIPGLFKARWNVHEVITSIMFNYIGMYIVNGLLNSNFLKTKVVDGFTNRTIAVDQNARNPYWFFDELFPKTGLDVSIIIAIATSLILYFVLQKTVFGRELRSVGFNRHAAKYAGVNEKRSILLSMGIAGMVAGLGGALYILAPGSRNFGTNYAIENTIISFGFDGIPVALLAISHPIGVLFSTFFISYIQISSDALQTTGVDGYVSEIINIIIAVIIYFSAFALIMTQYFDRIKEYFKKRKLKKQLEKEKSLQVKAGDN